MNGIKDFAQPVIMITPIDNTNIFILLKNLKEIFDFNYAVKMEVTDEDIRAFMEEIYNKPGASEFLMPREVIRDFLNVMSTLRQNQSLTFGDLCKRIEIKDERPAEDILLDSITEL